MLARHYDKRITFFSAGGVPDGYGGFTDFFSETEVAKHWCRIETFTTKRDTEEGRQLQENKLKISIRFLKNFSIVPKIHFFTYKTKKYVIESVTNDNLRDIDIELICTQYNG